jgi:hypothetical protein
MIRVAAHRAVHTQPEKPADGAVTDNPVPMYPDAVVTAPDDARLAPAGPEIAFGPAAIAGDSIHTRKWRVVTVAGGYQLQCEGLTPGGWKLVATKPSMREIRRFVAWLGMTPP